MGKASLPKTSINDTLDTNRERKKIFGKNRNARMGVTNISTSMGNGSNAAVGNTQVSTSGLPTTGGTMTGPLALHVKFATVANGVLNVSQGNAYSSRVALTGQGGVADDLEVITGASHAGQILFLQPIQSTPITLIDAFKSATAWASGQSYSVGDVRLSSTRRYTCSVAHTSASATQPGTGADWETVWYRDNINIVGADDRVVAGNEIVILQWDAINYYWTLVSGGGVSTGAGLGDNNTWTGTNTFTNTVTVEDASFGIRDQSDNTKVANFQCSGISSGTTRTYTLPNASTSLAGLGVTSQTWTGTNGFAGITNINGTATFDTLATYSGTVPVKFQGDGNNTTQTVVEIGKYGDHGVKFIAEILGDTGRSMSNPDGGSDIPVPGTNEPALSIKAAMIMNTYTMYDLDTLVFSQSSSSTTPAPANDWVYIEANTGTSGTPNLTGMTYNVPTGKTHQFKVNGSLKVSIDDDIEFAVGSTLEIQNTIANPTSLSAGGTAMAPPTNPTAYFKVHYNGADRYIPYYT